MANTYVICNQQGQYLTRKDEWVSGKDSAVLYHDIHHDQTLNQLIEINSKDIALRGEIVTLALDDKKRPVVVDFGPEPEVLALDSMAEADAV